MKIKCEHCGARISVEDIKDMFANCSLCGTAQYLGGRSGLPHSPIDLKQDKPTIATFSKNLLRNLFSLNCLLTIVFGVCVYKLERNASNFSFYSSLAVVLLLASGLKTISIIYYHSRGKSWQLHLPHLVFLELFTLIILYFTNQLSFTSHCIFQMAILMTLWTFNTIINAKHDPEHQEKNA